MAPLKLYHFNVSPPSRLALLAIRNLKLDVEIVVVNTMNKEQMTPEFMKINPQHTVPTIDDNGFYLWESRAIATYLVSSKAPGSSLYPTDVKKRAVVDARLSLDHDLQKAAGEVMYPIYALGATTIPEDKKEKVYKILGNLNTFMEGQQYVAGNELTVADLAFLVNVSTLYEMGANVNKFKNIAAWYKRLESIPGFQENLEGAQLLGNFLKPKLDLKGTWDDKMATLKLYHFPASPPSRVALLAIRNLKLDAEIIVLDMLKEEHLSPEFKKINPQHKVPTINDNGFILYESRAIAMYLASSKAPGNTLYPTDVKKKAVVDSRLFMDMDLQIATGNIIRPVFYEGLTSIPDDKKERIYKVLGNLNIFLEGQQYVAGNDLTVADLAFLATISTLYEIGANVNKFKNIAAWYKKLESIPGFQENLQGAQMLGNFIKPKLNLKGTWDD
ncbi:uncharacterized protein LOC132261654 [Phlebotomus argentipes]|uniref:uncharacterized protein LOC132261654 n=1 Tax=Phlebotomus argentipes TaxID=94469 RepID=UPI002892BAD0|nr:uncharacterized protein LOC132261654 [Phlebotomus argentipes]